MSLIVPLLKGLDSNVLEQFLVNKFPSHYLREIIITCFINLSLRFLCDLGIQFCCCYNWPLELPGQVD